MVIRHVKPILKLQETWQTRTVLWKNARTVNTLYAATTEGFDFIAIIVVFVKWTVI